MTRVPRRVSDGKPLPNACAEPIPEWVDEPTVPDLSPAELDEHLRQRAEHGQGDAGDDDRTFHRRVL